MYFFKDYIFNKKQIQILKINNIDFNQLKMPKCKFYGEKHVNNKSTQK